MITPCVLNRYVFHTASPFVLNPDDGDALIRTAVEGTTNVLRSVAKSKGDIKRVVLTSSLSGAYLANHATTQTNSSAVQLALHHLLTRGSNALDIARAVVTKLLPSSFRPTVDFQTQHSEVAHHASPTVSQPNYGWGGTAIMKSKSGPNNGKLFTEDDWNTDSPPSDAYNYSKVSFLLQLATLW